MGAALKIPTGKQRSQQINADQFRFGLAEVAMSAEQFATLFCNGRIKRVREWLSGELPPPPWVPALLAAMTVPAAKAIAVATAEVMISSSSIALENAGRPR